jgi:DNA-binding protein YbaB
MNMIGDLFSKLQEARERIEEAKKKLNDIIVEARSDSGEIIIRANANKTLTTVEIGDRLLASARREELEKELLDTVNRALEQAALMGEKEMKNITRDVLPNFPGLL